MIRVVRAGLLTTVQDHGRDGFQQWGVSPGGAMDIRQMEFANVLVGNRSTTPVLEITLMGPTLEFLQPTYVALSGADLSPSIDGTPVQIGQLYRLPAGSMLKFGRPRAGARVCLAVTGGIYVPSVLGSASTHVRGELGGVEGRRLQEGDRLELGKPSSAATSWLARQLWKGCGQGVETVRWRLGPEVSGGVAEAADAVYPIRLVRGPEACRLTDASERQLVEATYSIGQAADRMGYRLENPPALTFQQSSHMWSTGVTWGTVQVPADGMPIILMAERQTTGGYPRIGVVATVDRSVLAQRRPGDRLRFQFITVEAAQAELRAQRRADVSILRGIGWQPHRP